MIPIFCTCITQYTVCALDNLKFNSLTLVGSLSFKALNKQHDILGLEVVESNHIV